MTAKADEEEYRLYKLSLENPNPSSSESGTGSGAAAAAEKPQALPLGRERIGMGKRYERYRKEYTSRQLYSLFLSHRESAWFREKYGVKEEEKARRERLERLGRGSEARGYVRVLKEGGWDGVGYDMPGEYTLSGLCWVCWCGRVFVIVVGCESRLSGSGWMR